MTTLIQRLKDLEADVRYNEWPGRGEPAYVYETGSSPVLVSAPHAAVHTRVRGGSRKDEDEYTGGLARLVRELTGAHALYVRRRIDYNPNKDRDCAYKEAMAEVVQRNGIEFVMDLHGAKPDHCFGIALGTMRGKSCASEQRETIIQTLAQCGLHESGAKLDRLDVDTAFRAEGNETITHYVAKRLHIPAAQFEINAWLRIPERRPDASTKAPFRGNEIRIKNTILALGAVVQRLVK